MAWAVLFLAALFETAWAVGLKSTGGFTRLWPTVWVVACMVVSMGLLGIATKQLPIGTAYAVWTYLIDFDRKPAAQVNADTKEQP